MRVSTRVARTGFDIAVGVFEQLDPLGGLEGQERIRKTWESAVGFAGRYRDRFQHADR